MSFLMASFRGVQFYVDHVCTTKEWHHQTYESITDKPADTVRYAKTPAEYPVDGFMIGRGALLAKDLLDKACTDPSPGKLFHPLIGFKSVVCTSICIESESEGIDYFRVRLIFKEALDQAESALKEVTSYINKYHDLLDSAALSFVTAISVLQELTYELDRVVQFFAKIDGLLVSVNGLGIFADTAQRAAKKIDALLASPRVFFDKFVGAAKDVHSKNAFNSLLKQLVAMEEVERLRHSLATALVITGAKLGALDYASKPAITKLMNETFDDDLFLFASSAEFVGPFRRRQLA